MITEEIWNRGLTIQEYIERMDIFQKEMRQRVNDLRITSAEFQKLREFNLVRKILVLTEDRCKDSLMNIPIIAKIVEASPSTEMKIFIRHENPELTQFFSQHGYNNIPLCWVMNSNFSFCGVWMERPKSANRMLVAWKNNHPDYLKIQNDITLSDEQKKIKIKPLSDLLLDEMWNWYDTELQSETSREFQNLLNC
jgi:hypothetical protein